MASALVIVLVAIIIPVFILGVLGNIGVLMCVLFTHSLRTRANAIIVSLTASCLAFLVFVVPFTVDSFLHTRWRFSIWYCHAAAYFAFAFVGVTVYNIAALSLYRYFCVVHPMKLFLRSITNLVVMISLSWLIPVGIQIFIGLGGIARTAYKPEYGRCVVIKSGEYSTIYNILVLGGFLPTLGLTLYSYARIYFRVRGSTKRLRKQAERSSKPNLHQNEMNFRSNIETDAAENEGTSDEVTGGKREQTLPQCRNRVHDLSQALTVHRRRPCREQNYLTKICVVVFALFMISYGPMIILTIIYANNDFPAPAYMICTVIYWVGSCLHPMVYATLQPQIRRSFLRLVRCCWKPANRPPEPSSVSATL